MLTAADLMLLPVWVQPDHLASSARLLALGHQLPAVAVLCGKEIVGAVRLSDLEGARVDALVGDLMTPVAARCLLSTPLRELGETFAARDLEFAAVVDGARFCGLVTRTMLLKAVGWSRDAMTGLPWSDELRQWGSNSLAAGREISVLFIDLNDFGKYNKQHGHKVGDRVLGIVADYLRSKVDASRDTLVRYGGDEFAIGTLRLRDEAEQLADDIRKGAKGLWVQEGVEPVSFSVGIYGGMRTKERGDIHSESTLDNLINEASRRCVALKSQTTPTSPALRDCEILSAAIPASGPVTVLLSTGDRVVSGAANGKDPRERLIFDACLKALRMFEPDLEATLSSLAVVEIEGQTVLDMAGTVGRAPFRLQRRSASPLAAAIAEASLAVLLGRAN